MYKKVAGFLLIAGMLSSLFSANVIAATIENTALQWVKGESNEILLAAGFPEGLVEWVDSDIQESEKKKNALSILKVWFDQFPSICIGKTTSKGSGFFTGITEVDLELNARCAFSGGGDFELKTDLFIVLVNDIEKANVKEVLAAFNKDDLYVELESIVKTRMEYFNGQPVKPMSSFSLGTFSLWEFYQAVRDVYGVFEQVFGESPGQLRNSGSKIDLSVSNINKTKRIYSTSEDQDERVLDQPGAGSVYNKAWNIIVTSKVDQEGAFFTETFENSSLLTLHDRVVLQQVQGWAIAKVDVPEGSSLWLEADYKTEFPEIIDGKAYHRKRLEQVNPGFNSDIRAGLGNLRKYQSLREGADVYSHDFNLAWFFGEKLYPLEQALKELETDFSIESIDQIPTGWEYSIQNDGSVMVEAPRNYAYVWVFDNENISNKPTVIKC